MTDLRSLQKTAAIAAVTLLLQLCATSEAGNASRFTLAMNETKGYTAIQTGVKLKVNRQSDSISARKMAVIQLALTPKAGAIDSIIADGRVAQARLHVGESLSKKWSRSDEFRLKFSVERYWADQFHNEFRRSWIDADRRRAPSPMEIYGR